MSNNSKEYREANKKKYWGNSQYLRDQVKRVQARRLMVKKWKVKPWDWKEVDHIKWAKYGNWNWNIRVLTRLQNRRLWQKKATKNHNSKK